MYSSPFHSASVKHKPTWFSQRVMRLRCRVLLAKIKLRDRLWPYLVREISDWPGLAIVLLVVYASVVVTDAALSLPADTVAEMGSECIGNDQR